MTVYSGSHPINKHLLEWCEICDRLASRVLLPIHGVVVDKNSIRSTEEAGEVGVPGGQKLRVLFR